ncbi:hypothetical protein [Cohnella massiliensis]|uniref:hypothetical protein n=1 Tax=Cohnella massiliensis TaxID=1816691 RepID=UPI0009B9DDC6|nr:hypothetical protein [Cohnella massiliensis]
MQRIISSLAATVLLFSLFATSVFAAEPTAGNGSVDSQVVAASGAGGSESLSGLPTLTSVPTETTSPTTTSQVTVDRSDRTVTDGLYVDVYAPAGWGSDYIPEFTLELWSAQDNKLISSATGNIQNFDRKTNRYRLVFNHPGYRLGDRLALVLRKADGVIEHLVFSDDVPEADGSVTRHDFNVKVGTHFPFTVRTFDYSEGDQEDQTIRDLTGTKLHPFGAMMQTNPKLVGLMLKDASGALLKNVPVEIKLLEGKGTLSFTSDANGMVWIDKDKLTWKFLVSSAGRTVKDGANGKAEISLPTSLLSGSSSSAVVFPVVFEQAIAKSGSISVHLSTESNVDLSQAWSEVDVTLTSSDGVSSIYPLNLSSKTIEGIADGTYKVTVDGKYAAAKASTDTLVVSGGKANINIVLTPKHTLEISKGGKDYNFSIMNVAAVADKSYRGHKSETFAVTPGESFMIKDNDTDEIMTAAIDAGSPVTKVVLGAGIATGAGASSPKTGDVLPYLWLAFVLCASVFTGGVAFLLYKRKRTNSALTRSSLSIILVLALVTSTFSFVAPSGVHAASSEANVGGTPPATGGSYSSTPAGSFQTSDSVAVLQVGFLIDDDQVLSADATESDMQNGFNFNNESMMFYMAPNKTSHDLFTKQGSGLVTFERSGSSSRVKTLYGDNPLYPDSAPGGSREELLKRTLPYANHENSTIMGSDNFFVKLVERALYLMAPDNPNRSLSGIGTEQVAGETFRKLLTDYVADQNNSGLSDEDKMDAQIAASMMFKGYLDLIKERGILSGREYDDFASRMKEAFNQNKVILNLQTVVGISVRDGRSPLDREYAFMPMQNAVDWYLWVRQTARPNDSTVQGLSALRQAEAVALGGASSAADADRSPYKENGNIPYTFRSYARDYYAKTLQPSSESVPVSADYKANPFGGWGYQPWGYGSGKDMNNQPAIDAELNVEVVDRNGTPTGVTFTEPVKGWTEDSKRYLWDIAKNAEEQAIQGSMSVEHEGKTYDLVPDPKARFSLVDKKDNENINKSEMTKRATGVDGSVSIPVSAESNSWEIDLGWDTPAPDKLHFYLGGDGDPLPSVENKYKDVKENGKPVYSNAKLTLFVKAVEDSPEPVVSGFEVPQWRLSQYWGNIADEGVNTARFTLSMPIQTFINPGLSPSGSTMFRLIDPDLSNVKWAMSKAKLVNDTPIRSVTPYSSSASFNLAGDLLAIRDNSSVSNIKLASWVNNFNLFDGRITAASMGEEANWLTVLKQSLFQYGIKSPADRYTYSETRYSCDLFGCTPYRWSGSATPSYRTADYRTRVMFKRYVPKDDSTLPTFSAQSQSENGLFWQTKQSDKTFKVNPEVLYAYSDTSGNTSVAFAAGDKLREIKPVSFSMVQFDNVKVSPEVTGVSTATEAGAKQLAASLGANGKQVIYKDSAVTVSGKSDGDLKIRNFALDISSSALNKVWNPSGTYNPDEINQGFLSQYGTKGDDGKWSIPLTIEGRLKIGGKEFGSVTSNVSATEASTSQVVHTLEIRGGKLVGVDGNRSVQNIDADLKTALVNMKILSDDNVFANFEKNGGAALSESLVATLGNAVRGTNDLQVGQGWYSEDTTQLVVREYITTFALPLVTYTDKVPLEIEGLQVPSDKSQFFSVGKQGFVTMDFKLANRNDAHMKADSSTGEFAEKGVNFIAPNVSVLDSFGAVQ